MGWSKAWIALAILLLGAPLAWLVIRSVPGRPRAAVGTVAVDSLGGMHPGAAYDTAVARARRGGSAESLPYYARALRGVASDFWEIHDNYARALYSTSLGIVTRRGVRSWETRSSLDRAELVRAALDELARARQLAPSPSARADLDELAARMQHVYGLPWEAFVSYRDAQFADPGDARRRARADRFQWMVEHPSAATDAEPLTPVAPSTP